MLKNSIIAALILGVFLSSPLYSREYGEIMTVHSGDAAANGDTIQECYVRIRRESDNTISPWLSIRANTSNNQPTGCAIFLSAYLADKRIGYDLSGSEFKNICLADKFNC